MAGYSSTPLHRKLGLKEGQRVRLIGQPDELQKWLGATPEYTVVSRAPFDLVLLFENRIAGLEKHFYTLRRQIRPDGVIWVCWYKKASKKPTEITEDVIRDTALPLGFVDVKVCAVSDDWSGLKLVIRKSER